MENQNHIQNAEEIQAPVTGVTFVWDVEAIKFVLKIFILINFFVIYFNIENL